MKNKKFAFLLMVSLSLFFGLGAVFSVFYAGETIDMIGSRIINLATPIADTDAANKAYVDASSGGGVTFEGLTDKAYFGGLSANGTPGINQLCQIDYPSSYICDYDDLRRSGIVDITNAAWVYTNDPVTSCYDYNGRGIYGETNNSFHLWEDVDETPTADADSFFDMAIRSDGRAIFYHSGGISDTDGVTSCNNMRCDTATYTPVDAGSANDEDATLFLRADDRPVLVNVEAGAIITVPCNNVNCTSLGSETSLSKPGSETDNARAVSNGTHGYIVYNEYDEDIRLFQCTNEACTTGNDRLIDDVTSETSQTQVDIAIRSDGRPVIAATHSGGGSDSCLYLYICDDIACTTNTKRAAPCTSNSEETGSSALPLLMLREDDRSIVAYENNEYEISLANCVNSDCTSITITDTNLGVSIAMGASLGSDGTPKIYSDNNRFDFIDCYDEDCVEYKIVTDFGQDSVAPRSFEVAYEDGFSHIFAVVAGGGGLKQLRSTNTGARITPYGFIQARCDTSAQIACCS